MNDITKLLTHCMSLALCNLEYVVPSSMMEDWQTYETEKSAIAASFEP